MRNFSGIHRIGLTASTLVLVMLAAMAPQTQACMSTPPPPFCAKTLVLAKAGPPAVFVPPGVAPAFAVPYTVFWNMTNVGSPALCPPPGGPAGTFPATITLNIMCVGGPGLAAPIVTPVNLSFGFNPGAIPVTLPAGPPRFCTIIGRVDITLLDAMVLRARGDNVVCIVEPAPDDPTIPRLDLQTLSTDMQNLHPGDQGSFDYRITNNDPVEFVTVDIEAQMENAARLPEMTGAAGPPGTGVYSASDPIVGDNFPIGFDADLTPAGCIYLPRDPGNPDLSTAIESVTLAPGESHDFSLHTRAWGLCADGSCGEGQLIVNANYPDGDPAVSCTGLVHAVDSTAAPQYDWPGSGSVVNLKPLDKAVVALFGEPSPGLPRQVDNVSFATQALIADQPALVQTTLEPFENMNGQRVRYRHQLNLIDQPIQPNAQAFLEFGIQYFTPNPSDVLQVSNIELHAPTGFETIGPGAIVNLRFDGFGPPLVSIFDIMYQVSGHAVDNDTGNIAPVEIIALSLESQNPIALNGQVQVQIPPQHGLGVNYESVVINVDVRAYAHGIADSDLDGAPDPDDNCAVDQNGPSAADPGGNIQLDTDGDGIGNLCDPDIAPDANDCLINFLDLSAMRDAFFTTPVSGSWNPDADFTGDLVVNFQDLNIMAGKFFGAPGPSGLTTCE